MNLTLIGLLISYIMALYLFSTAFYEAFRFSKEEGKVNGTTFLFSFTFALIFTRITCLFQPT
ncbi:hypothetical protein [Peribacillus muralis]|uniref:hypothetical protein n=1 Tax=Peribacillus muralis TaxID=264697 RepID=UPI00070A3ACF|nr:hypothetical protein [Peribacillus muralis]MCK1994180.1 hypothetical protein [Peribacillus muralis]MCK2015035.1 hypothetical protein [Peribacillus muralis]